MPHVLKIDTGVAETTMKGTVDHGLVIGVVGNVWKRRRGRRGSFGVVRNSVVIEDNVVVEVVIVAGYGGESGRSQGSQLGE